MLFKLALDFRGISVFSLAGMKDGKREIL